MAKLTLQELESTLWQCADILRGELSGAEYKDYIFGMLFLKRLNDEFDEERPTVEKRTEKLYSLDAKMLLDDVNEMFGTNIEEENIDTIGGWLSTQVDTPPRVGQKANFGDDEFFVEEVDRVRITRVLVKLNHTVDGNTDI